jgi:hypothetical protein
VAEIIDLSLRRGEDRVSGAFAHVANVAVVAIEEAFTFVSGIELRRATEHEIAEIQESNRLGRRELSFWPRRNPWETRPSSRVNEDGTVSFPEITLPPHEWRYFVLTAPKAGSAHNVALASILSSKRLLLGVEVVDGEGEIFGSDRLHRFWESSRYSDAPFLELSRDDLDELREIYLEVERPQERFPGLKDALQRYFELDDIPLKSPLRFLGCMSILESIITHKPEPKDPYDSLARQVQRKMMLVEHRAKLPFPYELLDPATKPETIWKKIYDYRSQIAHGSAADFSGKLSCLRGHEEATRFVAAATISAMRQCVEEPRLMLDLREC